MRVVKALLRSELSSTRLVDVPFKTYTDPAAPEQPIPTDWVLPTVHVAVKPLPVEDESDVNVTLRNPVAEVYTPVGRDPECDKICRAGEHDAVSHS